MQSLINLLPECESISRMEDSTQVSSKWITSTLFEKAIASYKNEETIKIQDFIIETGFGEHLASTIFRCKIDFTSSNSENETLHVVVKAHPTDTDGRATFEGPLFQNEIRMYTSTLPAFHQLYERFGVKVDFAPELIYATFEPFPIIIIKDRNIDGYSTPRTPFEELEDSKMIIQRLSQFHAASYYLSEMDGIDFSEYSYSTYQNEALIYGLYSQPVKVFNEVLKTWDGYQHFIPKIEAYMEQIGEIGRKSQTPNKPGIGYNVLNHGDLHIRNILVKFNSQQRLQLFTFIDYQLSIFGSPAIDINYISSLLKRDSNGDIPFEDVVVYYHQQFAAALKSLGFLKEIPSLIDLNVELLRHGRTNVLMSIVFVPLLFVDWETMNFEDLMKTNEESGEISWNFTESIFSHPICKSILQRHLISFEHKGWL
ncbi:hypothetical protein Bhyg_15948 [Pseudolycoriella hygida]|uniref:CHK kinase-like domain-containing protein n=1 Tax=Pseudolycoriella hygida TaxID=35572 RepID=A0A9Q0RV22_9DIPT|nr:hypothetical protein Bhyg_15948 [Pseudolycoriella hygida]